MLLLVLIPRYQHLFCISAHLAQRLLWEKLVSPEVLRLSYSLKTFFVNWFRCFLWFWLFWSFNNRHSPVFGCLSFVHPKVFAKLLTGEMLRKLITWLPGAFVISFPFRLFQLCGPALLKIEPFLFVLLRTAVSPLYFAILLALFELLLIIWVSRRLRNIIRDFQYIKSPTLIPHCLERCGQPFARPIAPTCCCWYFQETELPTCYFGTPHCTVGEEKYDLWLVFSQILPKPHLVISIHLIIYPLDYLSTRLSTHLTLTSLEGG